MNRTVKEKKNIDLELCSTNFVNSISSLRNFVTRIGFLAFQEDMMMILELGANMSSLFGHPEDVKPLVKEVHKKEAMIKALEKGSDVDTRKINDLRLEIKEIEQTGKKRLSEIAREKLEDREILISYLNEMTKFAKKSPVQNHLLNVGALTTLLSIFENFIGKLIRFYYFKFQDALPSDARVLTLAELKAMENIEDAIDFIISKEVEAILRTSIEDQLSFFEKKLKIDFTHLSHDLKSLSEIFQRRNLLVHNRGVVNNIYLQKVDKDIAIKYGVRIGQTLIVKEDYILTAIDKILTTGLFISQSCWRKWNKDERTIADETVLEILNDALLDENYELVISISKFFPSFKFNTDQACKYCSINVAIALKQLNKIDEMEQFLSTLDWSSAAIKFDLALKALRNQTLELVNLIPKAISIGDIKRSDLAEWPLFKEFRCTEEYSEVLAKISKQQVPQMPTTM